MTIYGSTPDNSCSAPNHSRRKDYNYRASYDTRGRSRIFNNRVSHRAEGCMTISITQAWGGKKENAKNCYNKCTHLLSPFN